MWTLISQSCGTHPLCAFTIVVKLVDCEVDVLSWNTFTSTPSARSCTATSSVINLTSSTSSMHGGIGEPDAPRIFKP